MKEHIRKHWSKYTTGIVLVLLIVSLLDKPPVNDNTELQSLCDWQGNRIQELQKQVEAGRTLPVEFISVEHLRLWIIDQDWIGLNSGWTLEQVKRLQSEAFKDGHIIQYIVVRSLGTAQMEYWALIPIGNQMYYIEPMSHDVREWVYQ